MEIVVHNQSSCSLFKVANILLSKKTHKDKTCISTAYSPKYIICFSFLFSRVCFSCANLLLPLMERRCVIHLFIILSLPLLLFRLSYQLPLKMGKMIGSIFWLVFLELSILQLLGEGAPSDASYFASSETEEKKALGFPNLKKKEPSKLNNVYAHSQRLIDLRNREAFRWSSRKLSSSL